MSRNRLGFRATSLSARRAITVRSAAGFAVVRSVALGLCVGLRKILTLLGFAVPLIALAVIDLAAGVHPYEAGTAARRRHRRRCVGRRARSLGSRRDRGSSGL